MDAMERKPFAEWIQRHARGTLNDEATQALAEVVQTVTDVGKVGKVIVEITVQPTGAGGRTVAVGGKVSTKMPAPAPELGVFYVGDAGSLHRDDPYQLKIAGVKREEAEQEEVRQVQSAGEIRQVDADEAPVPIEEGADDN